MHRFLAALCLCACALSAQTKKILAINADQATLAALQGASPKARVVAVTPDTVMKEIADADAFIGEIKPEHVRAGKNLKWVADHVCGSRTRAALVGRQRSARQQHHLDE